MTRARRHALGLSSLAAVVLSSAPLAAAGPTRLLKGPYVTAFGDTTADVRFELDAPGPATVEFASAHTPTQIHKVPDPTVTANHVVHLTGLAPATSYTYAVLLGTPTPVGTAQLTTAHALNDAAPERFIVYGDDRSDVVAHSAVVQAMSSVPSDFLVNTGDVVADGASAADWQSFFTVEANLLRQRPLYLAIGNHELYDDEAGANFAKYFGFPDATGTPRPYGTARQGLVRFFFLNGVDSWDSGDERTWLERELAKADNEPGVFWRIVVVHQGPWSSGPHGPNPRLVSAHIPELLAAHKVDLVLSGHDHIYERGDAGAIKYVISGGGGAALYKIGKLAPTARKAESAYHYIDFTVLPMELHLVAHRLDGSVLDKCGMMHGGPWDCDPVAPPAPPPSAPAAAPAPSAAPPAPSSRCAVSSPGARTEGLAGLFVGFLGVLGLRLRRRVRRA